MNALPGDFFQGDTRAMARAITRVENRDPGSFELLRSLYPHTGRCNVIGVTGSPGVGKSSLVDRMAAAYRARGRTPAIVAVDPSSPFTGGAILGDRIRMAGLSADPGIFIRSMATRGRLGGLAAATADVVNVLDAASRDPVLVETVGVGQDEIDIVKLADVSIVVLVPGMGDDIQALKAGIMEIGDVFVINKCDRPGVEKMERAIDALLSLAHRPDGWVPQVVKTAATEGRGIDELLEALDRCSEYFRTDSRRLFRKRESTRRRLITLLEERVAQAMIETAFPGAALDQIVDKIVSHERDPYSVVDEIIQASNLQSKTSVRIDHIGIAVKSVAEVVKIYEELIGLKVSGYDDVPDEGVHVAMLPIGESRIELLESTAAGSPIEKYLAKRGEGIHHIALSVDDLDAALAKLKAAGARLINSEPKPGAHNTRIAFVHPSTTRGVLLELVEHVVTTQGVPRVPPA
jgi:LAO/AO transport system kinase